MKISIKDLKWYGRTLDYEGIRHFGYSASGFEFCFTGKKAACKIYSDPERFDDANKGVIGVYVTELSSPAEYKGASYWENFPEDMNKRYVLTEKETDITLFESAVEKTVLIRVLKISEVNFGTAGIKEVEIDGTPCHPSTDVCNPSTAECHPELVSGSPMKVEIIGDSITCGYGIEGIYNVDGFKTSQERADKAYGFLAMKALGAEFQECCWSGIGIISKYVNPDVNVPDTTVVMPSIWPYTNKSLSLRLGIEPEIWDEKNFSPDLVILHLGTNDASFVRDVEERRLAYVSGVRQFLEAIHRRSPKAKILVCLGVMGELLCDSQAEAVKLFTQDFKNVPVKVVRFPMQNEAVEGVAADWHPKAETHVRVAKQLVEEIKNW